MRWGCRRAGLLLATSVIAFTNAARAGETVTYSYDALGRLTRVERSGTVNNGVSANYAYDAADNRTNVTVNAGPAATPSVAGGSFETPEVGTGYAYLPGGSPATFAGNSGIAGNGSAWGFAAAPDGDQAAFVQGAPAASTISLPVTGLTPGASYAVSFRLAIRPGYQPIPVTVSFNGVALGTFTPGSAAFTATTSAAFTAASSSGTITFSAAAGISPYLCSGLDQVIVAAAGAP